MKWQDVDIYVTEIKRFLDSQYVLSDGEIATHNLYGAYMDWLQGRDPYLWMTGKQFTRIVRDYLGFPTRRTYQDMQIKGLALK